MIDCRVLEKQASIRVAPGPRDGSVLLINQLLSV